MWMGSFTYFRFNIFCFNNEGQWVFLLFLGARAVSSFLGTVLVWVPEKLTWFYLRLLLEGGNANLAKDWYAWIWNIFPLNLILFPTICQAFFEMSPTSKVSVHLLFQTHASRYPFVRFPTKKREKSPCFFLLSDDSFTALWDYFYLS